MIDAERLALVTKLYQAGKTLRQAANEAGVSRKAARKYLIQTLGKLRGRNDYAALHMWSAEKDALTTALWSEGFTHAEIGERVGHNERAVRNRIVVTLRLPPRTPGRRSGTGVLRAKPSDIEKQIRREDEADARAMAEAGRPEWIIAEFLGWTREQVREVTLRAV